MIKFRFDLLHNSGAGNCAVYSRLPSLLFLFRFLCLRSHLTCSASSSSFAITQREYPTMTINTTALMHRKKTKVLIVPRPSYVPWQEPAIPLPVKPAPAIFHFVSSSPPPKRFRTGQNKRMEARCRFPTGGIPRCRNKGQPATCGSAFPSSASSPQWQLSGVFQIHPPRKRSLRQMGRMFQGPRTRHPGSPGALRTRSGEPADNIIWLRDDRRLMVAA